MRGQKKTSVISRPLQSGYAALFAASLLVLNAATAGEGFSVDLEVEHETVKVAEPFWVTLSATAPKEWQIDFADAPDAFEELKVMETVDRSHEDESGTVTAKRSLQLESLLPGRYQIGPLNVRFIREDDPERSPETIERSTETRTVRVRSSLGFFDSRRLRDINSTVRIPWTWREWALAATAMIAVFAVGWGIYKGAVRRLSSQRIDQRNLLRQLDHLDESRLKREIPHDRFVVSVADVVRQSLQLAEKERPVYRTTNEWIDHLETWRITRDSFSTSDPVPLLEMVQSVLREADAIKFAGKAATLDQARHSLDQARSIVQAFVQKSFDVGDHDAEPGDRRS